MVMRLATSRALVAVMIAAAGLGCNAILDNDDGYLGTDTPFDATMPPTFDGGHGGEDRDASPPDLRADSDVAVTDVNLVTETSVEDRRGPETAGGDRSIDGPSPESGVDAPWIGVPDVLPDVWTSVPDADGGMDAPDDRSIDADARDDRSPDVDARSADEPDASPDRSAPPDATAMDADADGEVGPTAQDAGAPDSPDTEDADDDVGTDAVSCAPNTGASCGSCGGTVMCNGVCSNVGNPVNCEMGRCGLGCGGPCNCSTDLFCSKSGYCRTPCPSGQTCCDEDCSTCAKPPQVCP